MKWKDNNVLSQWAWKSRDGKRKLSEMDLQYVLNLIRWIGKTQGSSEAKAFRQMFIDCTDEAVNNYIRSTGTWNCNIVYLADDAGDYKWERRKL